MQNISHKSLVFIFVFSFFLIISPLMAKAAAPADTIGYWDFDGGNVVGKIGQGQSFANSGTGFDTGDSFDSITTSFTLSTWVRTTDADRGDLIMSFDDAPLFQGFGLVLNSPACSNNTIGLWVGGSAYICTSSNNVTDNEWHLISATFNGTTGKIYIDGNEKITNDPISPNLSHSTNVILGYLPWHTGSDPVSMYHYEGALDDVRIYNRALSASEITELFNFSSTPFIPPTDNGGMGGADQNTNPGGFVPGTDAGGIGGADQNNNPSGFVPMTDAGGVGGADQNSNPGGFVPTTDGGATGGADNGQNNATQDNSVLSAAAANTSRSSGGSSRGGSSRVLAVSSSVTLPPLTDISSCSYLTSYLNIGTQNDPAQVTKLQAFLKNTENIDVDINGIFDQKTLEAVKTFQAKYLNEIMAPWGETIPSGYVFLTTQKKINELYCKATFSLTPDQIARIESYRKNLESGVSNIPSIEASPAGESTESATTTPVEVGVNPIQDNLGNTQSASAINAAGGFWSRIVNFFKNLF